ncbi:MAG: triacylglycerol lipase [Circular genetic element sp.]|nr:MAG: triacylglycerol lipase [Circular genetic element sp.]
MDLANQTWTVENAAFHVSVLRQFRSLNPNINQDALLRPQFSTSFTYYRVPATANRLQWCIAGDQLRKIIYIDGCSITAQATNLINGYDNGTGPTNTNGLNQWAQDNATDILAYTESDAVFQPENLDVIGYSAGGVVGAWIVLLLKRRQTLKKLRYISFGSPRAQTAAHLGEWSNVPRTRWMTDADPIPLVPPRVTDAPILLPVLGLLTSTRYQSYVHSSGGLSIDSQGVPTDAVIPPIAAMNPLTSLATWYFGQEEEPNNPHALATYANRFAVILASPGHGANVGDDKSEQEPPASAPRRVHNRAETEVVNAINNRGEAQNAIPVEVNDTVLFKAVKLAGVWSVAFGDKIVIYAGNKKRAYHVARAGNDFLKSMPKQAVVDPETILSQMTDFFNAGVQPGGPVTPPISVGL